MNNQTQEALKMAIKALLTGHHHKDLCDEALNACKEALESQAPAWQGLSLSEIYNIADKHGMIYHTAWELFACAIEQALKEKNDKG